MATAEKKNKSAKKNPVGRPRIHDRSEIAQKLREYIELSEIPILAEFCYKNNVRRTYLYDMADSDAELSDAIKACVEKKEAQLEIKSLRGEVNPTQAIFSLKQIGWKDRQEVEATNHNMNTDTTQMTADERRARIDELNRRRRTGAANTS